MMAHSDITRKCEQSIEICYPKMTIFIKKENDGNSFSLIPKNCFSNFYILIRPYNYNLKSFFIAIFDFALMQSDDYRLMKYYVF